MDSWEITIRYKTFGKFSRQQDEPVMTCRNAFIVSSLDHERYLSYGISVISFADAKLEQFFLNVTRLKQRYTFLFQRIDNTT